MPKLPFAMEEIAQTRKNVDDQTRLTRWVLGVAAATLAASVVCVGAVPLLVNLGDPLRGQLMISN